MYSDKINGMTWSFSRITSYIQCKYQFYLKYIVCDDEAYLPEGNFYAEVGSYVHEILEKIFNKQLDVNDASQYFVDHFDENVFYEIQKKQMDKSFEQCAEYFADLEVDWLNEFAVCGVEKKIDIEIEGYKFTGYIDLLLQDKDTGDYIVIDHKSAKYPLSKRTHKVLKAQEESFEKYKKQMYLYCNAIKKEYGVFPKYIMWNYFKENDAVKICFNEKEYNEAIRWFIDAIHDIEKENDFEPTIDFFYCNNLCEFRNSCEYKKYIGESNE